MFTTPGRNGDGYINVCVYCSEKRVGNVYSKTKSFVEYVRRALSKLELDDSKVEPYGFLSKSEGNVPGEKKWWCQATVSGAEGVFKNKEDVCHCLTSLTNPPYKTSLSTRSFLTATSRVTMTPTSRAWTRCTPLTW